MTLDEFKQVEMRVGLVTEAVDQPGSEKLIKLTVSFGDEIRTIFTAVRLYGYTSDYFLNKKFIFVTNLEYKKLPFFVETSKGRVREESQGMILAVGEEKPVFVIPAEDVAVGVRVR